MNKLYLGDGVYIEDKDYQFTLTTENGISVTNTIHIEKQLVPTLIKIMKGELR